MKKVSGIELLQMIENREIKVGTKVHLLNQGETFEKRRKMREQGYSFYDFYTIIGNFTSLHLYRREKGKKDVDVRTVDTSDLLNDDFYIEERKSTKLLDKIKKTLRQTIEDIERMEGDYE